MTINTVVATATLLSGAAIVGCLICVGLLFNDINTFHDKVIEDLQEFQVSAD